MKYLKVISVLVIVIMLFSCSKMMMMVGDLAKGIMSVKTGEIAEVTPFIKMVNFNRPRPLTSVEMDYITKMGRSDTEVGSHVSMLLTQGMKFVEVDGTVQCNNQDMDFMGSGMYTLNTEISNGDKFSFYLKGAPNNEFSFEETYSGEKLKILKPEEGETIDFSEGFDIEWTPGNDPGKMVTVSVKLKQLGIETVAEIATFPDVGKARISKHLFGEAFEQATSIDEGPNTLVLERRNDEVRYIFNGDAIVSSVDADAVPINVTGKPPKAELPTIKAFKVKKGDIELNFHETYHIRNMANLKDIKNIALTSFVLKGVTFAVDSKTETTADGVYKVTKTWYLDIGEENLHNIANTMADYFMEKLKNTINTNEIPTDKVINTQGYRWMNKVAQSSDETGFYVTARDLTSFDALRQFKVKVGGTTSWYYDIAKASGSDAMFEVYFTLWRQKPKKNTDLTFDVTAEIDTKVFPNKIVKQYIIPSATAKWKSDTIEWKEGTIVTDFIKALKFEDFIDAYMNALKQFKEKQTSLKL